MNIILKNLTITNFKGIRSLSIDFNERETFIYAANEVGKTSISDAWHWLLTGKNSADQKDFGIKNTVQTDLNRQDHEVSAVIIAGGKEITLKKVYKEKWVKKRGEEVSEFSGHETSYMVNEVPMTQAEYQSKINGLLAENVLKMITNPLFFNANTTNWNWQKRREVLLSIAGTIEINTVLESITTNKNRQEVSNLAMILNSGKTEKEYKAQISSRKKKLKDELVLIPARIDEALRSKPEPIDSVAIEAEIAGHNARLAKIEAALNDKVKAAQEQNNKALEIQTKIHRLTTQRNDIRYRISNELNDTQRNSNNERDSLQREVRIIERNIQTYSERLEASKASIKNYEVQLNILGDKWDTVNAKVLKFDDHDFNCPTCKRAFPADDIETRKALMTKNFNESVDKEINSINTEGARVKTYIEQANGDIASYQNDIDAAKLKLEEFNGKLAEIAAAPAVEPKSIDDLLADNQEYIQLGADIAALQAKVIPSPQSDNAELLAEKQTITSAINELKLKLNNKDQIARAQARVTELENEEKSLSQQLADLEKTEFLLDSYGRAHMDIVESRINGKFQYVTFKLFDRQINGGEEPTCETMYKGVAFNDLNTAHRIWAGIDIINTLGAHYGVSAPIFLDNRESVTAIPESNAQIINLVVSPADKSIRVECQPTEIAA